MPLSLEQFGETIKQKYPQYKDVESSKLGATVIGKYPVYKDKLSPVAYLQAHKINRSAAQKNLAANFNPVPEANTSEYLGNGIIANRAKDLNTALDRRDTGQQTGAETAFQLAGNAGAGTFNDTVGKVLSPIQNVVTTGLRQGPGRVANIISGKGNVPTPESDVSIEPALDATVRKLSPRAQANIGAVFNTAMAVGTAKGINDAASGVKTGVKNYKAGGLSPEVQAGNVAGKITQGDLGDVAASKNALSKVDPTKVKTYQDLHTQLDTHVKNLSEAKGKVLETHTAQIKLPDLKAKVGDTTHNFVDDAFKQLETYYTKTNDIAGKSEIKALKAKAEGQGLTVKEIDDLAVRHGKDLNGYNANGELASGLSKQAAENTRAGLKTTARDIFNHDAYKAADTELSHTIKTRDLVKKMTEKVNELQQKIQKRGLGEKLGRLLGQGINKVSFGGAKGFVEHFLSRGTGLKTLNALDLEAQLQKNLKLLQEASRPGASEATIISKLKQMTGEAPEVPKPPVKSLQDKLFGGTFKSIEKRMVAEGMTPEAAAKQAREGGYIKSTAKPADLEYFRPRNRMVKIKRYDKKYPKYIPQPSPKKPN